jgi:PPP family 3-phenylpropionic acid transporter
MKNKRIRFMNTILRLYYLLFNIGLGCIGAFLPAYLEASGYNGKQIASIVSLGALAGLLGVPVFWGWLSDRLQRPDLVLRILAFGSFLGCVPLLFAGTYWQILGTFTIYAVSSIGVMSILDSVTTVHAKEKGIDFGRFRLFAPLGWFLGSVLLGYYIDFSDKAWNDISILVAVIVSFGLMFIVSMGLKTNKAQQEARPKLQEIKALFANRSLVLFFVMAMINVIAICPYWVFYGPLVKSHDLSPSVVGLGIGVGTLSEVIIMFYLNRIIKWLGMNRVLIIAILISMVRWFIIARTSSPYVLVGIQVLHSEIGLFMVACVQLITDRVPRKLVTTSQTVFYFMTYGVGQYVGIMLMGNLYDYFGNPAKLFNLAVYLHIIPLILIFLSRGFILGKTKNQNDE